MTINEIENILRAEGLGAYTWSAGQ